MTSQIEAHALRVDKEELRRLIQEAKKEGKDTSDMERALAGMTKGVAKKQRLTPKFIKQRFVDYFGGCQGCGNKDVKKLTFRKITSMEGEITCQVCENVHGTGTFLEEMQTA